MGIFIFSSVKEIESYKLEETKCNITRVAYPKENTNQNRQIVRNVIPTHHV
jgi:hypothetical protein